MLEAEIALIGGPNPLLPKNKTFNIRTPSCPIKSVKFRLLKEFKIFLEDNKTDEDGNSLGSNF